MLKKPQAVCFLDLSVGVGAFVIGPSQISTFFFLYRPPSIDVKYMFELKDTIHKLHLDHQTANIWISDDTNLPDIDW